MTPREIKELVRVYGLGDAGIIVLLNYHLGTHANDKPIRAPARTRNFQLTMLTTGVK